MKINWSKQKARETRPRLMDIRPGQVFELGGELFVKVFWRPGKQTVVGAHAVMERQHAVALGNGELLTFPKEERVVPNNGEYVPSS